MLRMPTSLLMAAVDPDPQKITAASWAFSAVRMIRRASSRSLVVCSPVPELSVCVFAYRGGPPRG